MYFMLSGRHSFFLPFRSLQYTRDKYGMCSGRKSVMNPDRKGAANCYGKSKEEEMVP